MTEKKEKPEETLEEKVDHLASEIWDLGHLIAELKEEIKALRDEVKRLG